MVPLTSSVWSKFASLIKPFLSKQMQKVKKEFWFSKSGAKNHNVLKKGLCVQLEETGEREVESNGGRILPCVCLCVRAGQKLWLSWTAAFKLNVLQRGGGI